MEAGLKALKCFLLSDDSSFRKDIQKNLNKHCAGVDLLKTDSFQKIKNQTQKDTVIITDDDFIHNLEKDRLDDFLSFVSTARINVILFTNYKKKLPNTAGVIETTTICHPKVWPIDGRRCSSTGNQSFADRTIVSEVGFSVTF